MCIALRHALGCCVGSHVVPLLLLCQCKQMVATIGSHSQDRAIALFARVAITASQRSSTQHLLCRTP